MSGQLCGQGAQTWQDELKPLAPSATTTTTTLVDDDYRALSMPSECLQGLIRGWMVFSSVLVGTKMCQLGYSRKRKLKEKKRKKEEKTHMLFFQNSCWSSLFGYFVILICF